MALILKTKLSKLAQPATMSSISGTLPSKTETPVVFPVKASYANKLAREIKNGKAAKGSKNCIIATSSVIEVQS